MFIMITSLLDLTIHDRKCSNMIKETKEKQDFIHPHTSLAGILVTQNPHRIGGSPALFCFLGNSFYSFWASKS
jgi:hypothetical protein